MDQTHAPSISITAMELDRTRRKLIVHFDLDHATGSSLTVDLRASLDGGITFLPDLSLSGDTGANITIGKGRSITWNYGDQGDISNGLIRVLASDESIPNIQQMVDRVDPERMMERLRRIAIPRHHSAAREGLREVRDSIEQIFWRIGLETSVQTVVNSGSTADNILGKKAGLIDPRKTFIVDGHYDAVAGTPGADDNATAVVAMLEIAEILAQYQFRNSLRFIGFSFEEEGIAGAQEYVRNGITGEEEIHGVLNMEMIGYFSDIPESQTMPAGFKLLFPSVAAELSANQYRGDFLTIVGNNASDPLVQDFVAASAKYVPDLKRIVLSVPGNGELAPDLRRSDHAPFWEAGIPALMLTDGSNYRNPNYHLPSDDVATIDRDFFVSCTKAVLAAAATLAGPINAGMDSCMVREFVNDRR